MLCAPLGDAHDARRAVRIGLQALRASPSVVPSYFDRIMNGVNPESSTNNSLPAAPRKKRPVLHCLVFGGQGAGQAKMGARNAIISHQRSSHESDIPISHRLTLLCFPELNL